MAVVRNVTEIHLFCPMISKTMPVRGMRGRPADILRVVDENEGREKREAAEKIKVGDCEAR